jgi:hypothetical protein
MLRGGNLPPALTQSLITLSLEKQPSPNYDEFDELMLFAECLVFNLGGRSLKIWRLVFL